MEETPQSLVPNAAQQVASSREYSELIGNLVTNFAEVEYLVSQLVWLLLAPRDFDKGRLVTVRLSFRRVLDLLEGLLGDLDAGMAEKTRGIAKKADQLRVERNKMVHSVWTSAGLDQRGGVVRGRMAVSLRKGQIEVDTSRVGLDELRDISNRIADLVLEIDALTDEMKAVAWRDPKED